jgi:hypothetical protein
MIEMAALDNTPSGSSGPRLSQARLRLARRFCLLLAGVYLAMSLAAIPDYRQSMLADPYGLDAALRQMGLSLNFFAVYICILNIVTIGLFATMSMWIFLRKPDDWVALLVALMLAACCATVLPVSSALIQVYPVLTPFYHLLRAVGIGLGLAVMLLFPDGRFVPAWGRYVLILWVFNGALWVISPRFAPPVVPADIKDREQIIVLGINLVWLALGTYAQVYRFRYVLDPVARQQTKWVVLGIIAFIVGLFAISLPVLLMPALRQPGMARLLYLLIEIPLVLACILVLPLAIAFSILKYRLWDIDGLIRRTLAYSALTVTLVVLYSGVVLVSQVVLNWLIGRGDRLAVVGTTLMIAALFSPLRRRIQKDIDRRFYRRKYNAEQMVSAFGESLRDVVAIEQVTEGLVTVAQEAVQPDKMSLWLNPRTAGQRENR